MKTSPRRLFAALLAALLPAAALHAAEEKVVRVYNWSDYIDEAILQDFEQETGIKVVYDVFDSNEVLETKLLAGSTGYDVVVPTANFLTRQIKAGVFQKLDLAKLPNVAANRWDVVSERLAQYEGVNDYSVNYMWGTTGLGYNEAKIKERMADAPLDSWDLLFKKDVVAKFADCGIYVLDTPEEVVPAALNYLGLDPNSTKEADLKKAEALLKSIRPYIKKFHSSEYINALANGDICLALGWSGDILQARDRAAEAGNNVVVHYLIPKEGALMWFDQMAIPKDAPHPDNALTFINYIYKGEVHAKASNYINYANGNKAAQAFINKEILEDPAIYPDAQTLQRLYIKLPYDPKVQRTITRLWTNLKSGK
ncbi:MAG TPA: polyamine ABC transporter substrate-binding protein [Candidatus Competibacteraceae bacterium]|nr:polyamine ABC transporter substrate-binding protein [Candidatus Competibacteraceae bacterium]